MTTAVVGERVADLAATRRDLLQRLLNHEWATRAGGMLPALAVRVRAAVRKLATGLGATATAPRTVRELTALLAASFRGMPTRIAADAQVVAVRPLPPTLLAHSLPRFRGLVAASRRLTETTGARVLLHGSLATDDWTGYRDADLLLLAPAAACASEPALAALRRACLPLLRALHRFDPLQHHGLFVMNDAELAAWPEHVLPLATLQRSLDLGGDGMRLSVCPHHDAAAARAEFAWIVDYLAAARPPRDAYAWKAYASVLMLLPAVWLGACGAPAWKGDSFARVARLVPDPLWEPQRWAARLRDAWCDPTPAWVRGALAVAPSPRSVALLLRGRAKAPASLLPADPGALLRQAHALALHLAGLLPEEVG